MVKMTSHKSSIIFNCLVVTMLSLFLIISMVEGRAIDRVPSEEPVVECEVVVGVKAGDTCFAITEQLNLTTPSFSSINPNLNCDDLFVGQWLCIAGKITI